MSKEILTWLCLIISLHFNAVMLDHTFSISDLYCRNRHQYEETDWLTYWVSDKHQFKWFGTMQYGYGSGMGHWMCSSGEPTESSEKTTQNDPVIGGFEFQVSKLLFWIIYDFFSALYQTFHAILLNSLLFSLFCRDRSHYMKRRRALGTKHHQKFIISEKICTTKKCWE